MRFCARLGYPPRALVELEEAVGKSEVPYSLDDPANREKFLYTVDEHGSVAAACREIGIPAHTVWQYALRNEEFGDYLRGKNEAWIKSNPDKVPMLFEIYRGLLTPGLEEDLASVIETTNERRSGLTNRDRREMYHNEVRCGRALLNRKFFSYPKRVS